MAGSVKKDHIFQEKISLNFSKIHARRKSGDFGTSDPKISEIARDNNFEVPRPKFLGRGEKWFMLW